MAALVSFKTYERLPGCLMSNSVVLINNKQRDIDSVCTKAENVDKVSGF